MGRSRKKAKKEFSKVIVSIVVLLNKCFTIAGAGCFNRGRELWMLSSIKKQKVKKEEFKDES